MTTFTLQAAGLDDLLIGLDSGYVVRSFEWSPGAIRVVEEDTPDADGSTDMTVLHSRGSLTFGIRMVRTDEGFTDRHRALGAFTHGRIRPTLLIDYEDGSPTLRATLSQGSVVAPLQAATHRDVVAQWSVPSGILESAEEHTAVVIPGGVAIGGIEFGALEFGALEFPLVSPTGRSEVVNAGDRDVYPIIRAFGPFGVEGNASDETVIGNDTSGRQMVITGTAIAAGDYLELDVRRRTIRVNSLAVNSRQDRVKFPESAWWTLTPGTNGVTFRPDTFSGNAQLQIIWRDAYS